MNADDVIDIFSRVLDEPVTDPEADFFDLGGDSLLATRVLSAVAREHGVELTFGEFVLAPTPAGVADAVASVRP